MNDKLLVIGSTSDIGYKFLSSRYNQYKEVVALFNNEKLEKRLDNLDGKKIFKHRIDLSNLKEVSRMSEILTEKYDISKVLHLASPSVKQKNFHNLDINDLSYNIDVQLLSVITLLKPIVKKMKNKREGKIVFILSSYIHGMPPKYTSSYVISKYALLGLLKSLASEYGQYNIQVNGISPSMVETKFLSEMHDTIIEKFAKDSPLKRNLLIDEILPAIRFFLSSESNYINGVNLPISYGG